MFVIKNKIELAKYIISKYNNFSEKDLSNDPIWAIKFNKSLYFLFANWGGLITFINKQKKLNDCDMEEYDIFEGLNQYLFDAHFFASKSGPIEKDLNSWFKALYRETPKEDILNLNFTINDFSDSSQLDNAEVKHTVFEYIDYILEKVFCSNDFALADLSMNDSSWINASNLKGEKIMNNEDIINEYSMYEDGKMRVGISPIKNYHNLDSQINQNENKEKIEKSYIITVFGNLKVKDISFLSNMESDTYDTLFLDYIHKKINTTSLKDSEIREILNYFFNNDEYGYIKEIKISEYHPYSYISNVANGIINTNKYSVSHTYTV